MWKARTHVALFLLVGAVLSASSGARAGGPPARQPKVYPPAQFRHRVSSSEIDVYWNCTPAGPDVVRLDGVVQNSGGRDVEFAEVEADAVNARGRSVSAARTPVKDLVLQINQISPFRLRIRSPGAGGRLDLYYEYRVPRSGLMGLGGSPVRRMVRDACSPTQHLVPRSSR